MDGTHPIKNYKELQRISLSIQRGNVSAVLGSLPAGKRLDEIFYL